ncbi:MAG: amidohydrolase family protein [Candidatus Zixiibacteriota bacterium]
MKTNSTIRVVAFLAAFSPALLTAHDYTPGESQKSPVLLKGGNVFTISGPMQTGVDLLFEKGRISAIGKNLQPPANAEIVDVTGMNVYPGLIAAYTSLGLTEIGAVRATNDATEVGAVTPEVSSLIAYNPDSELLPSVRSNGITTVQVVPDGGLVRGQSGIIHLDGWTREDASVRAVDGMHLTWPRSSIITAWWMSQTPEEQKKEMAKRRKELRKLFDEARAYMHARAADPSTDIDLRWQAMIPVLKKELPLFIHANDFRQIQESVEFAEKQDIRMILVGGGEATMLADLLRDKNIPVIFGPAFGLPVRIADRYDSQNRVPSELKKAGVKFCIAQGARRSSPASWTSRNLPFQAGTAVTHGLSKEDALRAITLSVAEILGIDDNFGSLDIGKSATIIVSEGDIMDHLTHNVTHMWIDGRQVDLDNRHKELYRKYQQKQFAR